MLHRAYKAGYRFPRGFGGFEASVYYAWDLESRAGMVEVRLPSGIRLGGSLGGEELGRELASIAGHR